MQQSNDLYCFLHIPKTAGTALRESIVAGFKKNQRMFSYVDKNHPEWFSSRSELLRNFEAPSLEQKQQIRIIYGHTIPHELLIKSNRSVKDICFLREPISRILSHINFIYQNHIEHDRNVSNLIILDTDKKLLPPLEIYKQNQSFFEEFYIVNLLHSFGETPSKKNKKQNIEKAKEILDGFYFIGITERSEEDFPLVCNQLGIKYIPSKKNSAKKKYYTQTQENLFKNYITKSIIPDKEIYTYALKKNEAIKAQLGINDLSTKGQDIFDSVKDLTGSTSTYPFASKLNFLPLVSIVIPFKDKPHFLEACIKSILNTSAYKNVEILCIDNGSVESATKSLLHVISKHEHIQVIDANLPFNFSKLCNLGAQAAKGKYIYFLNADTVLSQDSIVSLVETAERDDSIGAVGSKMVFSHSGNKIQEAGSIVWNDGSTLGYGRDANPLDPRYNFVREVDYCSACSLLVDKTVLEAIGGFDENYDPAYYEDTDLCVMIQDAGYKLMYQPHSVVFHHENGYVGSNAAPLIKKHRERFCQKWSSHLRHKLEPHSKNILSASNTAAGKRILFLDDVVPDISKGQGYPRAFKLLTTLVNLGYQVTFLPLSDSSKSDPYTSILQQKGIEVLHGEMFELESLLLDRLDFFDAVFVSRPHNMQKAFEILKQHIPKTPIVYDAEAICAIRETLKAKHHKTHKVLQWSIEEEINLANKADSIVSVSQKEQQMFKDYGCQKDVHVIGHPVVADFSSKGFDDRKDILFVGGGIAPGMPNEDALLYFLKEIFPEVEKQTDAKFHIVGRINSPKIKCLQSERVILHGFVEDIEPFYNDCKMFVIPHRFSAGIPWKLHEAMGKGLPSVVTSLIGEQAQVENKKEAMVAQDSHDFSNKIIDLYQDKNLWNSLRSNIREYLKLHCDPKLFTQELSLILKKLHITPQISKIKTTPTSSIDGFTTVLHSLDLLNSNLQKLSPPKPTPNSSEIIIPSRSTSKKDFYLGLQLLKREGILKFIHRLYWYIRGKRLPHEIPARK